MSTCSSGIPLLRRAAALAVAAAAAGALSACTLFQFAPQLTITLARLSYPAPNIDYSYTVVGPSTSSMSAEVLIQRQTPFGFVVTATQQTYLNAPSGTGTVYVSYYSPSTPSLYIPYPDGTYKITLKVLDPNGKPAPLLTADSPAFTVQTITPAVITMVDPPLLNSSISTAAAAIPVTITGLGFTPTMSLTVSGASFASTVSYVSPTEMTATVYAPSAFPGGSVNFTVTGANGVPSPMFPMPIVANVAVTSLLPASGSKTQSNQLVVLYGSGFAQYTQVNVMDSTGHAIPTTVNYQQVGSTSMSIELDLTGAAVGTATITLTNRDGLNSSAQTTFTVTS